MYIILNGVLKDIMSSGVALWLIVISSINAINENLDVVTHTHIGYVDPIK